MESNKKVPTFKYRRPWGAAGNQSLQDSSTGVDLAHTSLELCPADLLCINLTNQIASLMEYSYANYNVKQLIKEQNLSIRKTPNKERNVYLMTNSVYFIYMVTGFGKPQISFDEIC